MIEKMIWKELDLAKNFKSENQAGKARVLARRAVGKACQALLKSVNRWRPGMTALDSILELYRSGFAKPAWEPLLSHFILHVDEDHNLPADVDLVDEAAYLLPEITKMTITRSSSDGED